MSEEVQLSSTASLDKISEELKSVAEARKEFESLPNRDKILKQREQETIIMKG
jgi:hypothetical protein